jgi:two-component system CheB/CheR fusion protein
MVSHASRGAALRGMSILLVEDSDDARDAFTILLRSEGAEVMAFANGRDAVAAALAKDFDLLLTDYGLPDISGDRLISQIVSAARRQPRVVVVTGYGPPYVERARKAGANLVLTKPVEWQDLLQHLRPDAHPVAA